MNTAQPSVSTGTATTEAAIEPPPRTRRLGARVVFPFLLVGAVGVAAIAYARGLSKESTHPSISALAVFESTNIPVLQSTTRSFASRYFPQTSPRSTFCSYAVKLGWRMRSVLGGWGSVLACNLLVVARHLLD